MLQKQYVIIAVKAMMLLLFSCFPSPWCLLWLLGSCLRQHCKVLQAVLVLGTLHSLSPILMVASGCSSRGGDEGVACGSFFAQVKGCASASSQGYEWFWVQGGFMALASALWGVSRGCLSQKRSTSVNSAWELLYTKLNIPGIIPGHEWCMLATE